MAQQVVPVEAGTADRWSLVQTSTRAMPIVLVDPSGQLRGTELGVVVGTRVSPLAEGSLDEAFGFAVGAGSVGTSEAQAEAELVTETAKDAGAITGAVVGKQAADGDAEAGIVIDGSLQKSGSGRGLLIGQNLREGDTRMVINGDVDILPSGAMNAALTMAGDSTADGLEATDFLDVEMEQIAGPRVLITDHGGRRFEIADATEVESAENAADGSATESGRECDTNAGPTLASQSFNPRRQVGVATARRMPRTRRPITEAVSALALVATRPLGGGLGADFELGCSRVQSHPPGQNSLSERLSTERRKSGILMDVHSMSPKCVIASTQSASPVFIEWTTC